MLQVRWVCLLVPRLKSGMASLISMFYIIHLWPLTLWDHIAHTPLAANENKLWNLKTFPSLEAGGTKETNHQHPAMSVIMCTTCHSQSNIKYITILLLILKKYIHIYQALKWKLSHSRKFLVSLELSVHFKAMWKWILKSYQVYCVSMRK